MMTINYQDFIATKEVKPKSIGFVPDRLNSNLKQFQKQITELAIKRGRCAVFASTGLGKTLMQLEWASKVSEQTQEKVLILTPLAVAFQTVEEAKKFNIPRVSYAKTHDDITTRITVSNYDRLDRFDPSKFSGIVLDESGILKSFDGKTRDALIEMFADTQYKLCATATPSPNDFSELGNHSEFLGVMSFRDMLSTYFVHDGKILLTEGPNFRGWRLKRHATSAFWNWVSSWAIVLNHPRDIGLNEPGYDLPKLIKHQVITEEEKPYEKSSGFIPSYARTLDEQLLARRDSVETRVAAAVKLVNKHPDEAWLIWCGLNREADLVSKTLKAHGLNVAEVRGSDTREYKIDRLLGFCKGNPLDLVTKTKIGGFGMNWQHCHNMIFLGMNNSFEAMYQAIRRCWRFGQTSDVHVYVIMSAYEGAVLKNIERKEKDHDRMISELCKLTRGWLDGITNINENPYDSKESYSGIELPTWLKS